MHFSRSNMFFALMVWAIQAVAQDECGDPLEGTHSHSHSHRLHSHHNHSSTQHASSTFATHINTSVAPSPSPASIANTKITSSSSSVELNGYTYYPDSQGYILPWSGTASTTQFLLGPELYGGTACGMDALPSGYTGSTGGTGSGYLYAAINQMAFGANPLANAGGPGAVCGVCFELTPVSASGDALTSQATTFMIIDECPVTAPNTHNCGQCNINEVNSFGHAFHFDIASDAMNSEQYQNFYNGATDGTNWKTVFFTQVACTAAANASPSVKSWGCISGDCQNNDGAFVCAS